MKRKEPVWIDECDAIAIHDQLLEQHGGRSGLCDRALLQSALARPRHYYGYAKSPDIIEMATLYTGGIIRNHPFLDGNKRTGFVVGVLFLELNGHMFRAAEADATQAVYALADGTLDEAGYAGWLRANVKRSGR